MEGKDHQQETLIGFDEPRNFVTKPKSLSEKIITIEQWTDAFLVYSSIYLSAHPDQTQDLLQYMLLGKLPENTMEISGGFMTSSLCCVKALPSRLGPKLIQISGYVALQVQINRLQDHLPILKQRCLSYNLLNIWNRKNNTNGQILFKVF